VILPGGESRGEGKILAHIAAMCPDETRRCLLKIKIAVRQGLCPESLPRDAERKRLDVAIAALRGSRSTIGKAQRPTSFSSGQKTDFDCPEEAMGRTEEGMKGI